MIIKHPILETYFKPRAFEFKGRSSVYRRIGIAWFKKYLPTSGDRVRKHKTPLIKADRADRYGPFYQYELTTRVHEFRHWLGMMVFIVLAWAYEGYTWLDGLLVGVLFLLINVYPILLQRHNRVRIVQLLKRHQQPSPYA